MCPKWRREYVARAMRIIVPVYKHMSNGAVSISGDVMWHVLISREMHANAEGDDRHLVAAEK